MANFSNLALINIFFRAVSARAPKRAREARALPRN
jgi:hypothetical protein